MYAPGALRLEDSHFPTACPSCTQAAGTSGNFYAHVASPDVHAREDLLQMVLYVHGRDAGQQLSRLGVSTDGIYFEGKPGVLGRPYFRVLPHEGNNYAISMHGQIYRSRDGLTDFEKGPLQSIQARVLSV